MNEKTLKERIRTEMVKDSKPSYKERLQELLIEPEEVELLEIRSILNEIYKDRTVQLEDDTVLALDLTKYSVIFCKRCDTKQPFTVKNYGQGYIWFYCDECGYPHDFEIMRNDK